MTCIDCGGKPSHGSVTLHFVGARGEYDVCLPCLLRYREHRRQVAEERAEREAAR